MTKLIPYLFMLIFLPPVYIVVRYLGWACKEEREEAAHEED